MQLLVVSNYYPPCFHGGYELGCRDVVERLKARGHAVTVLTSDYHKAKAPREPEVIRAFRLASGGPQFIQHAQNVFRFLRTAFAVSPEVIYFWNQAGLSLWLAPISRVFGFRRAFFLSDTSFVSWRIGAFLRRCVLPKSTNKWGATLQKSLVSLLRGSFLLEGWSVVRRGRPHFASAFLRDLAVRQIGMPEKEGQVIHWGINPSDFPYVSHSLPASEPVRLLYVGQIIAEKGVHTAVEAAALLRAQGQAVTLTIVGGTSKEDYLAELKRGIAARGLESQIRFAGKVARAELPALYREHDLLLLTSIWDEPFAITPLEAMASGLPVVATVTGGSAEIFHDRKNSMVFPAGDAGACAATIRELCSDRALYETIGLRARELVASQFTLTHMVDQIENDLQQLTGRAHR